MNSEQDYARVRSLLGSTPVKLLVIFIFWALAHHMYAGMRVLLIDVGIGVERDDARRTAWVIAIGSVATLVMIAGILMWL